MDQLKAAAMQLKDKMAKNPLERALNEATQDVNWNASNKLLQEIADHTYSFGDFSEVMKYIWKRLSSERKAWRRILKTLTLIEYLVKNGSPRCIQEFKDEIYQIRTLQDFSHYEEGQDRGAAIRDVSKRIVQLLGDQSKIEEERKKAQEIRDRVGGNLHGIGSTGERSGSGFSSSSNRYDGFSSSTKGGSSYAGGGSDAFKSSSYGESSSNDNGKKITKSWKVDKTEESRGEKPERDEGGYVVKSGTKYDVNLTEGDKHDEKSKSTIAGPKKLAPPKGMKVPVIQQQQEVNLIDMDTPSQTSGGASTGTTANTDFTWGETAQPEQPKTDNSWNWSQPTTTQPAQPTQPTTQANNNGFDWNQSQQQAKPTPAPQPQTANITNLYQQPSGNQFGFPQQATGQAPFNFGAVSQPQPTQNNVNNLTSQFGQLGFNSNPAPTTGTGFAFNSSPQTQTTNAPQRFTPNQSPQKNDGFDDFQTAKPTSTVNEYKNYSQAEKSIIDLSDITNEATKKKEQQNKIIASKNSNEGLLYSTNDDLDSFMAGGMHGMSNMGGMSGMGAGYNPGMMGANPNIRPGGGMPNMGGMGHMGGMSQMGGMQQGGMGGMGGMSHMGGMPQNAMGMNMGYGAGMGGMNPNAGYNPMMGQMGGNMQQQQQQQGYGNPNMGGAGFGFR